MAIQQQNRCEPVSELARSLNNPRPGRPLVRIERLGIDPRACSLCELPIPVRPPPFHWRGDGCLFLSEVMKQKVPVAAVLPLPDDRWIKQQRDVCDTKRASRRIKKSPGGRRGSGS